MGEFFFVLGENPEDESSGFFFFFAKGEVAACADDQEREIG